MKRNKFLLVTSIIGTLLIASSCTQLNKPIEANKDEETTQNTGDNGNEKEHEDPKGDEPVNPDPVNPDPGKEDPKPDEPIIPDEPEEPIEEPEVEKHLLFDSSNFNKADFITLNNVVPNTSYPEEFTMNKNNSSITSKSIEKITKIIISVYGNYDNLVVYDKEVGGNVIKHAEPTQNAKYSKGKDYVFEFDSVNEFRIENTTNYAVYVYELQIFYKGNINSDKPFIENDGEIEINSVTFDKHSKLTQSGVRANKNKLVFGANSFIKSSGLGELTSFEIIEGNDSLKIYGLDEEGKETLLSLTLDSTSNKYIAPLNETFDGFVIKNESEKEIECKGFFVTYKEKEKPIEGSEISIAQALSLGAQLSRNRGKSTEYYTVTGTISSIEGSSITLTDGTNSIIVHADEHEEFMYMKYKVTITGQLENYYGKPQIINYKVDSYVAATYNLTLRESVNGTYTVSKTANLNYGEEVTVTASPNEGFYARNVSISGKTLKFVNNQVKVKITQDSTVSVVFQEINNDQTISGEGFTIHSLEMVGTYGDANLIQYGDFDILVDGGTADDGANLSDMLTEYVTDKELDLIIISHPDSDHYAGISSGNALKGLDKVDRIITNNAHSENETVINKVKSQFPNVVSERASELTSVDNKIYTINVDSRFSIDIMYSSGFAGSGKNNASIPTIFNYKNTKLFMGGDMEQSSCTAFLNMYPNLFTEEDYVIFKGLHHGSNGSNKDDFLEYLKPDFAFVNAPLKTSDPNRTPSYSTHPYLDAMVRIGKQTKEVYWAGINGCLTIECDGEKASAYGDGRTRDYYYYNKNDGSYTLVDRYSEQDITYFESYWYRQAIENLNVPDYAGILSNNS